MEWTAVHWVIVTIGISLCSSLIQGRFYNVGVKYTVILNVYSGRDDPVWDIDDTSILYNRIFRLVNAGSSTQFAKCLGYRGFTVEASNAMRQTVWKTVGRNSNRQLETLLLRSCPSHTGLSQHVHNHVYSSINTQVPASVAPADNGIRNHGNHFHQHRMYPRYRTKRQASTCSTTFRPETWNYAPVQRRNNCYNYATNIQTNTFAQPGRASGQRYRQTIAPVVYAAAIRDGLTPLYTPEAGDQCLVAMVIWEDEDYHFLRLDNSGYWSQKSGRTPVRNFDDSGNMITDPTTADRGPYTVFGGWLGVGPSVNVR